MGATLGVDLRGGGAFVTIGTSFHWPTSFAFQAGAVDDGVVFLGGAPNDGAAG